MKLFDFARRKPLPTPAAPPQTVDSPKRTPEQIIEMAWMFGPEYTNAAGSPVFGHDATQSLALIHIARSLASIAEDAEAIRGHLTRLRLVEPPSERCGGLEETGEPVPTTRAGSSSSSSTSMDRAALKEPTP